MSIRYFSYLLAFLFNGFIHSSINDYIYPFKSTPSFSNYGTVGLIQNPTARFHKEGTLALSWSHYDPYLRGSIVAYPFEWLEASFQYTDINNALYSNVSSFSGSQSLKDKSFDAKVRIFRETEYLPQIAIGLRDIGGTGLFGSEYVVLNKFIGNSLDISFGIGWGKLNRNSITNPLTVLSKSFDNRNDSSEFGGTVNFQNFFSGEAGYFGGIEFSPPKMRGLKIKFELDGTNYDTESILPLEQRSKINFGVTFPFSKNFITKLSYGRGNQINFGFSYKLKLDNSNPFNIIKEPKKNLDNKEIIKRVTSKSEENLYKASLLYLKEQGLSLQNASLKDDTYEVVYSHSKFRSPAIAIGRAIHTLNEISPDSVKNIKVSEINAGMGMYTAEISREVFDRYHKLNQPNILNQYLISDSYEYEQNEHVFNPTVTYPATFFSMGPELMSQIGGPDGFFFGDLKWTFDSEVLFRRGLSLISSASYSVYDNMNDLKLASDSILPHVRTEIVQYLKQSRGFSIKRMQLNYYDQLSNSLFMKLSGGIYESMFSGYGIEVLYRPYKKDYGVGLDVFNVYQREFDQMFDVQEYNTVTGHLTLYYRYTPLDILFTLKGGKYLARDSGFTFDLSKDFDSGMRMGAYFSLTDISREEFGEGSFDKGFYFWIPVELFSSRYFKRTFGWGLRPITRDGAQSLIYGYPLWGVTDSSSNYSLRRRAHELFN